MREELYLIDEDGKKHLLDIDTPSGITLKYESNFLSAFESVTAAHSYTFNLPMTARNMNALGINGSFKAQMVTLLAKCQYCIDGLALVDNGKMYVSAVGDKISAVMTWALEERFAKLMEENPKLSDLREDEELGIDHANYNGVSEDIEIEKVCYPVYNSGVVFNDFEWGYAEETRYLYCDLQPMPAMPVGWITKRVEEKYGISFPSDFDYYFVPFVRLAKSRIYARAPRTISFSTNTAAFNDKKVLAVETETDQRSVWRRYSYSGSVRGVYTFALYPSMKLSGSVTMTFSEWQSNPKISVLVVSKDYGSTGLLEDVVDTYEIDGEWTENGFQYVFSLNEEDGKEPLVIQACGHGFVASDGTTYQTRVMFAVDSAPTAVSGSFTMEDADEQSFFAKSVNYSGVDYDICFDPYDSLPDLSVAELYASLFAIEGAFISYVNGRAVIAYTYDYYEWDVYDWSDKIQQGSEIIQYSDKSLAQKNYILMATDDIEYASGRKQQPTNEDTYLNSGYKFSIENPNLDKEKVIAKLPIAGRFGSHGIAPKVPSGNTICQYTPKGDFFVRRTPKNLYFANNYLGQGEIKPCVMYGYTSTITDANGEERDVLRGFPQVAGNSGAYDDMFNCPLFVECYVTLSTFEVMQLEMLRKVYIEQLHGYFIIISIEVTTNPNKKVKLFKIG